MSNDLELFGEVSYDPLRDLPYGEYLSDCDFTIGHVKTVDGAPLYGIIWYAGGEAWSWCEYKAALASARRTAQGIELVKKVG